MDQVIQNKIFNAKSEIAEIQERENKWHGHDFRFSGMRDRVHFGTMIAAAIITFIISFFVVDSTLNAFMNSAIAFGGAFMVVGTALTGVDDSFNTDLPRYNLIEARKSLIEKTLDARIHEGRVFSADTWTELTIERDDKFEKVFVRTVNNGDTETVEMKDFVNS